MEQAQRGIQDVPPLAGYDDTQEHPLASYGALVASFLVNDSPGPVALAGLTAVLSIDGGLVHRALAMPVLRRLAPPVAEALPQEP